MRTINFEPFGLENIIRNEKWLGYFNSLSSFSEKADEDIIREMDKIFMRNLGGKDIADVKPSDFKVVDMTMSTEMQKHSERLI